MNTALVVACIAGAVSLASVWFTAHSQLKLAREQRHSEAKVILDKCRRPLLDATWALGERVDELRSDHFLDFLAPGNARREDAPRSTLFRFAHYFGWREYVRAQVQLLRFEEEEDTSAAFLGDITQVLAARHIDDARAMLWDEEQRGIGELMFTPEPDAAAPVSGHARFWQNYESVFKPWMKRFGDELLCHNSVNGDRLRLLQSALAGLVICLDEERAYPDNRWTANARGGSEKTARPPKAVELEKDIGEHLARLGSAAFGPGKAKRVSQRPRRRVWPRILRRR